MVRESRAHPVGSGPRRSGRAAAQSTHPATGHTRERRGRCGRGGAALRLPKLLLVRRRAGARGAVRDHHDDERQRVRPDHHGPRDAGPGDGPLHGNLHGRNPHWGAARRLGGEHRRPPLVHGGCGGRRPARGPDRAGVDHPGQASAAPLQPPRARAAVLPRRKRDRPPPARVRRHGRPQVRSRPDRPETTTAPPRQSDGRDDAAGR